MKNDTNITVRISEEEKERLQLEAEAKGITVSDVLRETIAEKTGRELLGKDLIAREKGIKLSEAACPFCGVKVDWKLVKIYNPFLFGESGKHCPACDELVFTYSKKAGWEMKKPESEEEESEGEEDEEQSYL